jgi:hypothetical protein
MNPVDLKEFPQYLDYIIHPVCISQIEEKLSKEQYLTPRELLADFKWIYHNSVIFNSRKLSYQYYKQDYTIYIFYSSSKTYLYCQANAQGSARGDKGD